MTGPDDRRARIDALGAGDREAMFERLLRKRRAAPIPRHGDGPAPLSYAQQRLWFLHELDRDSAAFNLHFAFSVRGTLDLQRLCRSLDEIIVRHEVLRTMFEDDGGVPVQVVRDPSVVAAHTIDLRGEGADERSEAVRQILVDRSLEPFDLRAVPLLRLTVIVLGERECIVQLVLPHLVADGWSLGRLADELQEIYRARGGGHPARLAPLPIQYADYAAWQRSADPAAIKQHLSYWRTALGAGAPPLELPADRPRLALRSNRGSVASFVVPPQVTAALADLAREHDATLFMVLAAALATLLARYAERTDIALGTPIANRTRPELEPLIGMFGNTLVLQGDLGGNPSFGEALDRFRSVALDAYDHQDVPFERLVEELQPQRDLSHTPLFQVMLVLQNGPRSRLAIEGVTTTPIEVDNGRAAYDLTVELTEVDGLLQGVLAYNSDLFEPARMRRLTTHLVNLLSAATQDPSQPISLLALLGDDERRELLTGPGAVGAPTSDLDPTVPERIAAQAERTPAAVAVRCGSDQATYSELVEGAARVAGEVIGRGLDGEQVVAVLAARGIGHIEALLGILDVGAAYLPIGPDQPAARIRQVIESSGCALVIVDEACSSVWRTVLDGGGPLPPSVNLEEILVSPASGPLRGAPEGSALAYVLFTSGSTGVPKGAMVEHAGMTNHVLAKIEDLAIDDTSVVAQNGPQSFDVSVWQSLAALTVGGVVVVLPDEIANDPGRLLDAVEADGITVLQIVPSIARELVRAAAERGDHRPSLAALRWLVPTGDALPAVLCEQWFELYPSIPILNTYGSTECSDDQCHIGFDSAAALDGGPAVASIGRPIRNMRAYVLDPFLQPVPVGVPGELYVGGVGVGRGYARDPRRTAEVFVPDPFSTVPGARLYRTRDRARSLPDGSLEFLGRRDHLIKLRGHRVEPGEIEAVLVEHPHVDAAVVVAIGDGASRRLTAYIASANPPEDLVVDLRASARLRLPLHMVPTHIFVLDALPMSTNGKVDRARLPSVDAPAVRPPHRAPVSDSEAYLASVWEVLLEVERIGLDDNFFEVGGHSLVATRVVARVRSDLGIELPVRLLFETETLEELAGVVDALAVAQDEADLTPLLDELDSLTDEQVAELLRRR